MQATVVNEDSVFVFQQYYSSITILTIADMGFAYIQAYKATDPHTHMDNMHSSNHCVTGSPTICNNFKRNIYLTVTRFCQLPCSSSKSSNSMSCVDRGTSVKPFLRTHTVEQHVFLISAITFLSLHLQNNVCLLSLVRPQKGNTFSML